ncbi:ATP-binding protein [Ruminococcus albus]|uniref:Histidine kinase-, DNA gyrase B-, and HSP90-like ATPase n=1 Tax=Ruminococcus albus TaxID=1264 RepID=A0A1I1FM68_RUMAL|nr:ATP-binding protein [Ruminococcus albus]SFC00619.1 Histidine kinase-, DNA gyrase B-, and HSP90-like ATPase [Ruminococcus albus]
MNESVLLNLTPDPKVLIALTHTHIQPFDALCELIDNSIDSFSAAKLQGTPISAPIVRIDLPKVSDIDSNKGVIRISDNGPGLSVESTEKALRAGFSGNNPYDTLGLFGMGFNISTGKMGSVTTFYSAREDSEQAVEVTIDLNEINETKNYQVKANLIPKNEICHGTIIEVSNWWPEGNSNRGFIKALVQYGAKKIRQELGRRYSTILREEEIKIFVNETPCEPFEHCVWGDNRYVERKKYGRIPAVFRFDQTIFSQKKCMHCTATLENYQNQCPSCGSHEIRTVEERIYGWVGIQRFDSLSEFGIDLIRNGRAIRISEKNAFFEYVDEFQKTLKDYPIDSNFGRIVGEVHLDHVPVDFMKQDFQRNSPEWHRAISFLRGDSSLQPTQPGAENNNSPIFKLFQGYRKVKTAGKTDLYMGTWDSVKEEPRRISRDVEKDFYERFKKHEPGYYDDAEWYKKVEEAEHRPVKQLPLCPVCGCQNLEEAEVCMSCQTVLKGKNCISCNETIPLSAKICPKCGKSQEIEVIKPWICNICGAKNNAIDSECVKCGAVKGEENHLSKEYLLKHSEKDDHLSINNCFVELANGHNSSALNVNVYTTNEPIKSNFDNKSLPLFTDKVSLDEIAIFVDKSHRMFKSCRVKVEQIIASEIAEHIYLLNKSVVSANGKHTISFISWQIIEKYWADKMEGNSDKLISSIESLFNMIRERLMLSNTDFEVCKDMMTDEQTKTMINNMMNSGVDITKLSEITTSSAAFQFVSISTVIQLFSVHPELFFDGVVWNEPYKNVDVNHDVLLFTQERIKGLYKGCLDDLQYYIEYKSQSDFVIQKTRIAVQFLNQKVAD